MTDRTLDPGIQRLVDSIAAIDDHAHPNPPGQEPDPDRGRPIYPYDHPLPLRQRLSNPEFVRVWRELWGYEHDDASPDHLRELIDTKQAVQAEQGADYMTWVLDQLNIETMLPVTSGPQDSLPAPRFRWLSFADWLMWPIPATGKDDPRLGMYAGQIGAAYGRAGLDSAPATLDEYVQGVLEPELSQIKANGAVGLKFHTPYYRAIDFGVTAEPEAAELYRRGRETPLPFEEHKRLEDYLFHVIANAAARLELPVQMHTGHGMKEHFEEQGSNPLLMEPAIIAAPDTKFLILHAGWPFDRQAVAALAHENVYLDISAATVHLYAHNLAAIVRDALEWFPEKILYGTDAYSEVSVGFLSGVAPRSNFLQGWEEKAWLMDRTARDALTIALTDMRDERVIRDDDVARLAQLVLHDNATDLYRL